MNFNFTLCRMAKQILLHAGDAHSLLLSMNSLSSFLSQLRHHPLADLPPLQVRCNHSPFCKKIALGTLFFIYSFLCRSPVLDHWLPEVKAPVLLIFLSLAPSTRSRTHMISNRERGVNKTQLIYLIRPS